MRGGPDRLGGNCLPNVWPLDGAGCTARLPTLHPSALAAHFQLDSYLIPQMLLICADNIEIDYLKITIKYCSCKYLQNCSKIIDQDQVKLVDGKIKIKKGDDYLSSSEMLL